MTSWQSSSVGSTSNPPTSMKAVSLRHAHCVGGMALCLAAAVVATTGCHHSLYSAPKFPAGDRFVIPMIDPEYSSRVYVTATINGRGPFVFLLDTGAGLS